MNSLNQPFSKNIQKQHFVGRRLLGNEYYEISYTSYYILTSSILGAIDEKPNRHYDM